MGSVPAMKKGAIGCAARTVSISDPDRALSSSFPEKRRLTDRCGKLLAK